MNNEIRDICTHNTNRQGPRSPIAMSVVDELGS
jgi:hypothetical protein